MSHNNDASSSNDVRNFNLELESFVLKGKTEVQNRLEIYNEKFNNNEELTADEFQNYKYVSCLPVTRG
eukprot:Pgem_evm1s4047